MSRVSLPVVLVVGVLLAACSCEGGTIDVDKARPPSFAPPPSVPAAAGPTKIPAGFLLPDEGTKPRVGEDWRTENWTQQRPALFDPCHRTRNAAESFLAATDGRTVHRLSFGISERRTLVLYPDTAAASLVMGDLRRALTNCYQGKASGTWVWTSRDRPSLGDDAVVATGEYESRDFAGGLNHTSYRYVMVQVRNAIVLVGAESEVSEDLPATDVQARTAGEAVAALHRAGWPRP